MADKKKAFKEGDAVFLNGVVKGYDENGNVNVAVVDKDDAVETVTTVKEEAVERA